MRGVVRRKRRRKLQLAISMQRTGRLRHGRSSKIRCVHNPLHTNDTTDTSRWQMVKYWETCPGPSVTALPGLPLPTLPTTSRSVSFLTGFDQHCQTLLAHCEEGWVAELGRYLGDMPQDAMPDMDVVERWQVQYINRSYWSYPFNACISRTITESTQLLDKSPLTSFPVKHPPSPANAYSLLANKSQQIVVRDSEHNDLRNSNS
jgi:hypothetical protein